MKKENFFEKSDKIEVTPNYLYYEFVRYRDKKFLSFLSDKIGENFKISESKESLPEYENAHFDRKIFKVILVLENSKENKKLILEGRATNFNNDGGMPSDFKISHNDFSQTEINNMLSKFSDNYRKWIENHYRKWIENQRNKE